jgi:two-component system NarL family response regulator
MRIRVMLADDHKILREALRGVLAKEDDIEVVAEAGDGFEAMRLAREHAPDVLVMDIGMPGMGGIDATRRLAAECPGTRILALSTFMDRSMVLQMLEAGASGYVVKSAGSEELLRGIRSVARNNTYLSPEIAAAVVDSVRGKKLPAATPGRKDLLGRREREVLALLAEGKTSSEIADTLHIATSTVEVHRRNIMRKLGLHSVAELTKYAIRSGLTSA